jgi:restriction system protein
MEEPSSSSPSQLPDPPVNSTLRHVALAAGALVSGTLFSVVTYVIVRAAVAFITTYWPWLVAAFVVGSLLLLAGTLIVAAEKHNARLREEQLRDIANLRSVDLMTGPEFELLVAALLRRDGYRSVQVVGRTGDRGVDVTAQSHDGRNIAVQCKRQKKTVSSDRVRNLIGALHASYRGHMGVLVTSSGFTKPALAEGDGHLIFLDRHALARWMDGETLML